MCEYCLDKGSRNTYDISGFDAEGTLALDDIDNGLSIKFSWKEDGDDFGVLAKALIRYCPWCGRKLDLEFIT